MKKIFIGLIIMAFALMGKGQGFKNKFFVNNSIMINNTINESINFPSLPLNFDIGYFSKYYFGTGIAVNNIRMKKERDDYTTSPSNSIGPKIIGHYSIKNIGFLITASRLFPFNDYHKSKADWLPPSTRRTYCYEYGVGTYYHVNKNISIGGIANFMKTRINTKSFDINTGLPTNLDQYETNASFKMNIFFLFNKKKKS